MNFLISYHRPSGQVAVREMADAREAQSEVLRRELAETDSAMEHVVISAASLDDVKRTHSRYFMAESHPDVA